MVLAIFMVLWVDWENFDAIKKENVDLIKEALKQIRNDEPIDENHRKCLSELPYLF